MIWIRIRDPRSLGSWCIKGTDESTLVTDSSFPLMHHDPSDLGSVILIQITPKELTQYSYSRYWTGTSLGRLAMPALLFVFEETPAACTLVPTVFLRCGKTEFELPISFFVYSRDRKREFAIPFSFSVLLLH